MTAYTTFAVAVLGVLFLGLATLLSLYAALFKGADTELTLALVVGLTGITGQASAYLFRLNGKAAPGGQ